MEKGALCISSTTWSVANAVHLMKHASKNISVWKTASYYFTKQNTIAEYIHLCSLLLSRILTCNALKGFRCTIGKCSWPFSDCFLCKFS
uniref:Uncharacterized protein n=1 Tax=Amphimedon queenslandica TaxID=400682 RepID=A0A1X7TXD6_AMPQE